MSDPAQAEHRLAPSLVCQQRLANLFEAAWRVGQGLQDRRPLAGVEPDGDDVALHPAVELLCQMGILDELCERDLEVARDGDGGEEHGLNVLASTAAPTGGK
jgi:hypothetical protein